MTRLEEAPASTRRIHRAWWIALVTFLALVAASAFRSSTGVMLQPIEDEFGWSRATTSGAVSLNLILYGLTAPFAAALMERWGVRRLAAFALSLVAIGSGAALVMDRPWQLWLAWGFGVGIGTGALALVFGAIIANRWFVRRRGLVVGLFSAASSAGQLVFLPVLSRLVVEPGWRWAAGVVTAGALALIPISLSVFRNQPHDVGLTPYGAPTDWRPEPVPPSGQGAAALAVAELRSAGRTPTFWLLFFSFWVCGWSTNGLVGTHFVPAAHDHGMPVTASAGLLALIGLFDIVGTLASGWLTDRFDPRKLLLIYYGLRGLSLLVVPSALAPEVEPSLFLFVVFYGLDWVATVPPTVALCREHFGIQRSGVVFGWIFAAHMVGAGVAANFAGWV
ncbi:MAG: MFS transporter, partial [Nocardioides sp.]